MSKKAYLKVLQQAVRYITISSLMITLLSFISGILKLQPLNMKHYPQPSEPKHLSNTAACCH